jgi:MFS family permease
LTDNATPALNSAIRKGLLRLVPFLVLMYVAAFLDRSNVGFAKTEMQAALGLTEGAFAFGAGVFFLGYALLEVPSNLLLHRIGARVWLPRIMITWGLVSAATAFVRNETGFYWVRVLLGIAEAGFFPGVIFYISLWFPASVRARVLGIFYFGFPLSMIVGGPLSGALMDLPPTFGLAGWQWMFVAEGLLASVVGLAALWFLVPRPEAAAWLNEDEKAALALQLVAEAAPAVHGWAVLKALVNPRVLLFIATYFAIQVSVYGATFYLPTNIAHAAGSKIGLAVGALTAIPWLVALPVTIAVARRADRSGGHAGLSAVMLAIAAAGIALSGFSHGLVAAELAFCLAVSGFVAAQPLFWTLPSRQFSGPLAAGGIALINSIGNLGGFLAPNMRVYAEKAFGDPHAGVLVLAGAGLIAAGLLWVQSALRPSR